jgi:ferrous iron transport protein B
MSDCHTPSTGLGTLAPPLSAGSPSTSSYTVALVGPPNAGKSTLFNRLTGLRQKVANFPGVTVEKHLGKAKLKSAREVVLIDLPGIYSLQFRSEDERVTHDVLKGTQPGTAQPNAIILILDSTNLSRHLLLATPILQLGLPTLVVLNMIDDLHSRGGEVDPLALAAQLGAPVALISASKGIGIEKVVDFLEDASTKGRRSKPTVHLPVIQDVPGCRQWASRVVSGSQYLAPADSVWTRRLDSTFLHPFWGPLIFLAVIIAVFQAIFKGAEPLMDGIDSVIAASGQMIGSILPEGMVRSLIVDGIWAGVGSVVIFLPQILVLFLFIGVLEDSGYLARAALIADRTMRRVGLQGKSFIPLLSAYACAVPAIMSTRTIESKRDRIATILIAPFMTCSARLPIYLLLIAAFIPEQPVLGNFLGTRALALLGLYALGFLAAFFTAMALQSSVLKSEKNSFILEMPPYRFPTWRSLLLRLYDRALAFLKRAGTVILIASVILWALASLPLTEGKPPAIENSYVGMIGKTIEPVIQPLGFNWKVGVGLITSLAARELIVGTLGTLYGMESSDESEQAGEEAEETSRLELGNALKRDLTPAGAVSLLVFFAFAMQCLSTTAVVRRETGGWKWAIIQFGYMTTLAYVSSLVIFQVMTRFFA